MRSAGNAPRSTRRRTVRSETTGRLATSKIVSRAEKVRPSHQLRPNLAGRRDQLPDPAGLADRDALGSRQEVELAPGILAKRVEALVELEQGSTGHRVFLELGGVATNACPDGRSSTVLKSPKTILR